MKRMKARICSCKYERIKEGAFVYIKGEGCLTTRIEEATPKLKEPVAYFKKEHSTSLVLELTEKGRIVLGAID